MASNVKHLGESIIFSFVTAKEHVMDVGNRLSALNTRDRSSSSSSSNGGGGGGNKSFKTNVTNYCTRHGL